MKTKLILLLIISANLAACRTVSEQPPPDPVNEALKSLGGQIDYLNKQMDLTSRAEDLYSESLVLLRDCANQEPRVAKKLKCEARRQELLNRRDKLQAEEDALKASVK